MKTGIVIGLMMAAFSTSSVWAESAQQGLMKSCNADAKKQSLAGAARKTFMKTCLSTPAPMEKAMPAKAMPSAKMATPAEPAKPASPAMGMNKAGKPMTAQQQRMKGCNAEAKSKEMKGDPRKAFMKTCLSNKK